MGAVKTIGKGIGKYGMAAVGFAMPLVMFNTRRSEGQSVMEAGAKTLAEEAAFSLAPGPMMALYFGGAIAGGIYDNGIKQGKPQSASYRSNFGGDYFDSEKAYTMRQAGSAAIQRSGMNARSVLGSEARRYNR